MRSKKNGKLSRAELEHLRWSAEGYTPRQIAQMRGTSWQTEKNHRQSIFKRWRVRNMTRAMIKAWKRGLVV